MKSITTLPYDPKTFIGQMLVSKTWLSDQYILCRKEAMSPKVFSKFSKMPNPSAQRLRDDQIEWLFEKHEKFIKSPKVLVDEEWKRLKIHGNRINVAKLVFSGGIEVFVNADKLRWVLENVEHDEIVMGAACGSGHSVVFCQKVPELVIVAIVASLPDAIRAEWASIKSKGTKKFFLKRK